AMPYDDSSERVDEQQTGAPDGAPHVAQASRGVSLAFHRSAKSSANSSSTCDELQDILRDKTGMSRAKSPSECSDVECTTPSDLLSPAFYERQRVLFNTLSDAGLLQGGDEVRSRQILSQRVARRRRSHGDHDDDTH
ncbi:MAG: hypothetical protein ACPIOQ_82360, partial [Promethearchaeia archaeon]